MYAQFSSSCYNMQVIYTWTTEGTSPVERECSFVSHTVSKQVAHYTQANLINKEQQSCAIHERIVW